MQCLTQTMKNRIFELAQASIQGESVKELLSQNDTNEIFKEELEDHLKKHIPVLNEVSGFNLTSPWHDSEAAGAAFTYKSIYITLKVNRFTREIIYVDSEVGDFKEIKFFLDEIAKFWKFTEKRVNDIIRFVLYNENYILQMSRETLEADKKKRLLRCMIIYRDQNRKA